mgnify:CR=1 FL=1
MTPSETTKKSPMRVAPGICVQEVYMKAVGLAVFGEDFEFGFAHSEVPFGLGVVSYLLLLMYSTML